MANRSTITSANSVLMLTVAGIAPVPQKIEGFSTDAAWSFDDIENVEIVMGIDGNMSAGFVHVAKPMMITVMPNSKSADLFELWYAAQQTAAELFFADGTAMYPATGKKYALSKGVLSRTKVAPDVKKTLQSIEYRITWESISPSLI